MAKPHARTLRPADEVSHYRIVGPLGAGGMGEVYLAEDESLERKVALKILPPDLVRSEERVRRFVLEAKSASSLSHPNIVTIYEIGADVVRSGAEPPSDPVHFISMELVSGKTLSTLIHEDQTDLRTLLGFLSQAADGLAKAHAAGIVHRDLKPGNIMVTADGFAKVLDFGLAKLTEKRAAGLETSAAPTMAADATAEGIVVGTAGYMSPEQVQGKTVDTRSDIFSFGCILYEAATRQRPFAAETAVETMHKILNEKPAPVEEVNPKAPAEVRRLIRRCLAKSPEQRLQSMKDLSLELREIADEYDTLSPSGSSGSGSSGGAAALPAKRGAAGLAIALGSMAVVAAFGLLWWAMQRNMGARSQPFQTMRMTPVTSRGDVADGALSPDGRYLAYLAGSPGAGGQTSLRVRQVATGSDVEVLPMTPGLQWPTFSPDGNYVFYLARRPDAQNYRALFQVPSLGGTPQQRAFDVDSRVSFSPDGKQIVFWRGVTPKQETRLIRLDLDSGREQILAAVRDAEEAPGSPSWLPNGKQIAAALFHLSGKIHSTIVLFDAESGRRSDHVIVQDMRLWDLAWLRDGTGLVACGWDSPASSSQIFLVDYPGSKVQRVTNDFSDYSSISTSAGDAGIGAVRQTTLENIWIADATGAAARPITTVANPESSPGGLGAADSVTLTYSAPRDQGLQIFALGATGGEPRALTSGSMLSFSAQGAHGHVVFTRADFSGIHVWQVRTDGTGLRQVTTGIGEETRSVSPDGQWFVYQRHDSLGGMWLRSVESGQESALPRAGTLGFSPNGQRLLMGRSAQDASGLIRVTWLAVPVAGGSTPDSLRLPGPAVNPKWSSDSRGMMYQDASDPARNVQRQSFGASAPTPVTSFTEGRVVDFAPAPDGRKLAVVRAIGASMNVWLTEADGSHPVQVTHFTTERVFELKWLPDSHALAIGAGTWSSDAVVIRSFR